MPRLADWSVSASPSQDDMGSQDVMGLPYLLAITAMFDTSSVAWSLGFCLMFFSIMLHLTLVLTSYRLVIFLSKGDVERPHLPHS